MMRAHQGLALALVLLSAAASHARHEDEDSSEINLTVGGQKVINAAGVQSYSEGVPGVIQVKVPEDGRRLVITAARQGTTTLLLIYPGNRQETYLINVYARAPQAIRNELKTLLAGLSGVDVREVGGRLFLDGAVPTQDDIARIDRIVALYGGQVASLVVVDPARQRTNINLKLTFVQLRKNVSHTLGVRWPANFGLQADGSHAASFAYTFDFIQRAATQGQLMVTANLFPSLDLLGVRGWAKVKSEANVITTNGGTAEYHTGGEVNVALVSGLGNSQIQKIPFGTVINVTPRLDPSSGLIVVTINAEQSDLNPVAGQPIPGRLLTQTKTNVHVKLGESILLSGFKEKKDGEQATGIPLLMRIPILGYLFRSENANTEDTENILFITPTVIEHSSPTNAKRIEEALKRFEDYDG
jgi:pilus assembly protein CpaC